MLRAPSADGPFAEVSVGIVGMTVAVYGVLARGDDYKAPQGRRRWPERRRRGRPERCGWFDVASAKDKYSRLRG